MSSNTTNAAAEKQAPSAQGFVTTQGDEHNAAHVDMGQDNSTLIAFSGGTSFATADGDADTSLISTASGEGDTTTITVPDSADDAKFPVSYLEAIRQEDAASNVGGENNVLAPDTEAGEIEDTKPAVDVNPDSKYLLVDGTTRSPKVGRVDPELLFVTIRDKDSGAKTSFEFRLIKCEEINWNDKEHITKINSWRRQIFRRAGFGLKKLNVIYQPDEDAFLMLFWEKVKAVATVKHNIGIPNVSMVEEAFNDYFTGHVIQDKDGNSLPPRAKRDSSSIQSKFARSLTDLAKLRKEAQAAVNGRTGPLYIPFITDEEIQAYRENKAVNVDDPSDSAKNAAVDENMYKGYRQKQIQLAKVQAETKTLALANSGSGIQKADSDSEDEVPIKLKIKTMVNRNFKGLVTDTKTAQASLKRDLTAVNGSAADTEQVQRPNKSRKIAAGKSGIRLKLLYAEETLNRTSGGRVLVGIKVVSPVAPEFPRDGDTEMST